MIKKICENALQFEHISEEEKQKRGILGILYGPVASIVKSTRNGRMYSEELWEKSFKDPIVDEYFKNGGLPLELDHPTDRDETCSERIAAMMPNKPEKDDEGHLIARIDILDTPMGRIAYTLAKYGFQLGISSRGSGDTYTDNNGNEAVDPDTFELKAWDLVLLPAVEDARLKLVENLQNDNTTEFKKALHEALENSSANDKELMQQALNELNIDYTLATTASQEEVDNIDVNTNDMSVDNNEDTLVADLQKQVELNQKLDEKVRNLQEELSVCYTKDIKSKELIEHYKSTIINLTETAKKYKASITKINALEQTNNNLNEELSKLKSKSSRLNEDLKQSLKSDKILREDFEVKLKKLERLNKDYENKLLESNKLNEELKINNKAKFDALQKKVENQKSLIESYKAISNNSVNKYIELQARIIGVTPNEIKNRLNEHYSLDDIDEVCDNLRSFNINISKLPFNTETIKKQNIKLNESIEPILKNKIDTGIDDEIDNQLAYLARLN